MTKYRIKASWLIKTARKYKNYQEKRYIGTRTQMWDFHWNPGTKNYTIWAMLYKDFTNRNFQGQPWCAISGTVIVVLTFKEYLKLSDAEAIAATKEFFGGCMPYNCQEFVNLHKKNSKLNHTPALGCPVIYHTGSKYGHWGICVTTIGSNGKTFSDVEGNTSGGNNKVDPDGGAIVEKYHELASKTLFWHPDFLPEDAVTVPVETYKVKSGNSGLTVLADSLTIRTAPGTDKAIAGTYAKGTKIFPIEKTFINHKAWYKTTDGWIGTNYLEGWVQEECGLWWYMHKSYTCTINEWEQIEGQWYYMEDTGYIRTNAWIQSADKKDWYYVGEDGAMYACKWLHYKEKDYYLGKDGKMVTDAYKLSSDGTIYYYLNKDGVWDPSKNSKRPKKDKIVE